MAFNSLLCAFLLALAGTSAAQQIIARITASVPGPPFTVGTAVDFTCDAVDSTTNTILEAGYQWACGSASCLISGMGRITSQTISTTMYSEVLTLTDDDVGDLQCTAIPTTTSLPVSVNFPVTVTGYNVYDQNTLQTVLNNTVLIADSNDMFNSNSLQLVCVSATGTVAWSDPSGTALEDSSTTVLSSDINSGRTARLIQNLGFSNEALEGYYQCVRNQTDVIRIGLFINGRVPPSFLSPLLSDMTVSSGDSVSLQCSAVGNDLPTISWFFNNTAILPSDSRFNIANEATPINISSTLTILNADPSLGGNYTCVAGNIISSVSDSSIVTIPVELLIAPEDTDSFPLDRHSSVDEDDLVELNCTARANNMNSSIAPSISWYKDGQLIMGTESVTIATSNPLTSETESSLVIDPFTAEDSGVYHCIASVYNTSISSDPLELTSGPSALSLLTPPVIILTPPTTTTIAVDASGSYERLEYYRDQELFSLDGSSNFNVTLDQFSNFFQNYTFSVSNPDQLPSVYNITSIGSDGELDNSVVVLVVEYAPPNILTGTSDYYFIFHQEEDDYFSIDCRVTGAPLPDVTTTTTASAYLNITTEAFDFDINQPSLLPMSISTLTINSLSFDDHNGTYVCIASNINPQTGEETTVNATIDIVVIVPVVVELTANSSTNQLAVGQSLSLFCNTTEGNPTNYTYTWTFTSPDDDMEMILPDATGAVYVLSDIQEEDFGVYQCTANNSIYDDTDSINITQGELPSITIITSSSTSEYVLLDSSVTLTCSAVGSEPLNLTWTLNGETVDSSDGVLTLDNTQLGQFGTYVCTASNALGMDQGQMDIFQAVGSSIISDPSDTNVTAMTNVTLVCSASGQPPPQVTWTRAGAIVQDGVIESFNGSLVVSELTIANSSQADSGVYMCTANNTFGQDSANATVNIFILPEAEITIFNLTLNEGDRLDANCTGTGNPVPTLALVRNGVMLEPGLGSSYSLNASDAQEIPDGAYSVILSLTIPMVTDTDSGTYQCVAVNVAGNDTAVTNLTVNYAPRVMVSPSSLTITFNSSAVFNCTATSSPPSTITWSLGSTILANNTNNTVITSITQGDTVTSMLTLINPNFTQLLMYNCSASNAIGTREELANLTVEVLFEVTSSEPVYTTNETRPVTFQCTSTGIPVPSITWYKNGTALTPSSDPRVNVGSPSQQVLSSGLYQVTQNLTITNTTDTDSGNYSCAGTNIAGTNNDGFRLVVQINPVITEPPANLIVTAPANATFTCTATGLPPPAITWRRVLGNTTSPLTSSGNYSITTNGSTGRQNTSSLTVLSAGPEDEAVYECVASNVVSTVSREATLTVYVVSMIMSPFPDYTTNETRPVTFQCSFTGIPVPSITWYRNGSALTPSSDPRVSVGSPSQQVLSSGLYQVTQNLTITNTTDTDSGNYSCVGNNTAGSDSDEFGLVVQINPVITDPPANLTVTAPDNATFTCTATGLPPPAITWRRVLGNTTSPLTSSGNYSITTNGNTGRQNTSSLTVLSAGPEDKAVYECVAGNVVSTVSRDATLTVYVASRIVSLFSNYTTNETRPVTFQCSSTGIPVPSITWYRNGTALINSTRISISTSSAALLAFDLYQVTQTLTITNTTDTDSGNYSCAGNNTAGSDSDEFELVVQFSPRPIVSPQALTVSEGMEAAFVCIVTALPLASVTWFFNSSDGTLQQPILNSSINIVLSSDSVVNSTLVVSPVSRLREGQYICNATNLLASITDTASLNVQYIPDIYDSANNLTIIQPNNVTVFCSAIANPRPDIQWFKMNESLTPLVNSTKYSIISIPTGDRNRSSSLFISDTNPSDAAEYICRASNSEGERNTSITVTVHVIPEISSSNQTYVTNEMTPVVFQCSVTGIPAPSVTWYRDGIPLDHSRVSFGSPIQQQLVSSGLYQVTQNLTITNTTDTDSGNYSCVGTNAAGNNTALFELVVQLGPVFFSPPQHETTVQPGSTTFNCSAQGRPRPSLRWLRNVTGVNEEIVPGPKFSIDEMMSGNREVRSDLTIVMTQALDAGQYLCVADNVVRSVTRSVTLTVHVSPAILFPAIDQLFIVNQTDSLIITCNASAIPTPSITWYRNGSMLDSSVPRITIGDTNTLDSYTTPDGDLFLVTQELTLSSAIGSDTDMYSCSAANLVLSSTRNFSIFVQVPPTVVALDGDRETVGIEEMMAAIHFRIDDAAPPVNTTSIRWFFSSDLTTEVPDGPGVIDITMESILANGSMLSYSTDRRSLTISNISQSDEGRYFFMATNPAGSRSMHTDLIVHGPPRIFQGPRDQTIIDALNVTFRCEALADPVHSVVWSFNSSSIITTNDTADTAKYSINRDRSIPLQFGSLTVSNVQYSDRGVYQCSAVNYVGSVSASATLTVQVTPVIHQISSALTANITNTTSLYCVATGNPRPTISWLKNGIEISTSQIIQPYTLNATDVIELSDIQLPNNMTVPVDASLSDLLSGDTVPLLRELGSVGLLVFTAVERGDTANYSCVATNMLTEELSDQSDSTELTIQERPDPPRVVTIVSWTARSVYLTWEPSFNGNLPILGYNIYQNDLDRNTVDRPVAGATHPDYTTTQLEFNITSDIIPYTKYVFTIEACNLLGCGARNQSEPRRTETDAPDSPPRNCTMAAVSSTSLQATWVPPAEPNGLIEQYTVSYRPVQSLSGLDLSSTPSNTTTTTDNSTQLVLSQLLKGTSYSIMLTAYTFVGPGPSSTDQCTTFTLEDAPDGPPLNLSVYSDSSQSLIVSWARPDLALQNGIITHNYITYTSARSGRQLTMNATNTTNLRAKLKDLEIFTDYNITVASGTFVGTGPMTSTVVKTLNDTSGPPVDVRTTNPSSRTIKVQWSAPPVPNGIITRYRVYYIPSKTYTVDDPSYNSSQQQTDVPVNSSEVTLTELYLDTTYTIYVTAFNGAGEGNKSDSILQFVSIPDDSKLIEVPALGAPDTSEGGLRVTINLTPPSTLNGRISHYQVITVLLDQETTISSISEPDVAFTSVGSFSTYSTAGERSRTSRYAGYITAEFGRELFPIDGRFTVGDPMEAANDRTGQYPNNPLQYGSRYTFFLRAYPLLSTAGPALKQQGSQRQYTTFSSSEYTRPVFQTVGDPLPGIAGGVIAGLLVAVAITAIVLIVVVLYWRYTRTGKMEPDTSIVYTNQHLDPDLMSVTSGIPLTTMVQLPILDDDPLLAHPNIPTAKFEMHVQRMHANQNGLFAEEYKEIVENSPRPAMDVGLNPDNKCRNRYANIQCYDHSRVRLMITNKYDHDYINANFLPGYNRENEYIASQGPLPDTVGDFWRMVWDHDVYSIVMLTNLVEKMKVKCSQYWPDSCGLTKYAYVSVSMVSTEQQADCVIRNFEIVADGHEETRTVRQFHFTSWPDFGVPRHALPVLQLVRQVRRYHKYTDERPMIVHCSAGVGRTGTFVTIDVEMQRWQDKNVVNPCEFVTNLRKNRNHMVQTEGQYVFLHDAILEGITSGWTDFTAEQLPERMAELEEENVEGESGYHTEFNSLRKTAVDLSEFQAANLSANRFKNRLLNALPFDHNRVKMKKILGKDGSDYINASFIDGYKEKNSYIATQGPTRETVEDFWRMIWEQETAVIVMLTQVDERGQEMCSQYWPGEIDSEMEINGKTVITMSEQNFGDYVHRQLKVTEATRDSSVSRIVHQLQFLAWPELGAPKVGSAMIDLVGQVVRVQQQTGNKPIVVHCSAGIGRTGAFCALTIAIERVKAEGLVNVYQTVKHLRTQRPHMVQTLEQYIFCYRAVLEYVDSLSPYANFKGKKK